MNGAKKIAGELVVSCGNPAVVLDFVPEALGEIAFAIKCKVTRASLLSVFSWRE